MSRDLNSISARKVYQGQKLAKEHRILRASRPREAKLDNHLEKCMLVLVLMQANLVQKQRI